MTTRTKRISTLFGFVGAAALAAASSAWACTVEAHPFVVAPSRGVGGPIVVEGTNRSCGFGDHPACPTAASGTGNLYRSDAVGAVRAQDTVLEPLQYHTGQCPTDPGHIIGRVDWTYDASRQLTTVAGTGDMPLSTAVGGALAGGVYKVCADPHIDWLWSYYALIGGGQTPDDPSCTSGDADNASGMDDGSSAPAGACMDDAATTFDSSAYEAARAQGLAGAEAASSEVAEGDPTGVVDEWCVPAALRENHRMTRSGCALLRELADANPNRKYYSQQLKAFAAAKPGYQLARVKARSFATTPDAHHVDIDPASEQYVADGGSASYNFSFGLGIKGASIGAGTTRTYATHSGRIHPWGLNPRLYHVSWMAIDSDDRIDAGIQQETGGAILWSLPEGPAPLQGTYQVPVWTCFDPAFKVAKCHTN